MAPPAQPPPTGAGPGPCDDPGGLGEVRTHRDLDPALCGAPTTLKPGRAEVVLETSPPMRADESGLVHGGFVFGLADHAAMLAVNEPTVVLARAEVRFLAPVRVGERLLARAARRKGGDGRPDRPVVEVTVERAGEVVLEGAFHCAVPESHVLAGKR